MNLYQESRVTARQTHFRPEPMLEIMAHLPVSSCYLLFFGPGFHQHQTVTPDLFFVRACTRERSASQKGRLGAVREPHFRYAVAQYR